MPEMLFHVRWPDGSAEACYSPSLVVEEHLEVGVAYPVADFVERARTALTIGSDRVQARYGVPCANARGQLAAIEATAARLGGTGDVLVERFQHRGGNTFAVRTVVPGMTSVPNTSLNDGTTIPQLGYGVFQVPEDETYKAVSAALQAGYRHIDTAKAYGNEAGVGKAIADSGVARDDIYVTTKLWNADQGYDSTLKAFDTSVSKLGVEKLDLYLIHWPVPAKDEWVNTWKAFEQLQADGRVTSIGVSNFTIPFLERLFQETSVKPVLNQVELHPSFSQTELRAFHTEHDIVTEAWSPLGGQGGSVLDKPELATIAEAHGKTPAQVVIRWHLQLGNVVIPKSATPSRIEANIDVFDFELSGDEMATIATLDDGSRVGPDPAEANFE